MWFSRVMIHLWAAALWRLRVFQAPSLSRVNHARCRFREASKCSSTICLASAASLASMARSCTRT